MRGIPIIGAAFILIMAVMMMMIMMGCDAYHGAQCALVRATSPGVDLSTVCPRVTTAPRQAPALAQRGERRP
jgi:hypothetical protein